MHGFLNRSPSNPASTINPSRRDRIRLAAATAVERLESRRLLSTVTWTGAADGNWSTASNWSTNTVPGANDDVIINPAGTLTITVDGTQAAKSVTATGDDTLNVAVNTVFTISGDSTVNKLNVDVLGTLNTNGTLTLPGTTTLRNVAVLGGTGKAAVSGSLSFIGGPSYIRTTVEVTGSASNAANPGGAMRFDAAGAKMRILGGGTFFMSAGYVDGQNGGIGVVVETGGIATIGGGGGGLINVDGGSVNAVTDVFGGGSVLYGSLNNATLNAATGTSLSLGSNSAVNVSGDIVVTGPGRTYLSNSSFNLIADTKVNFSNPNGLELLGDGKFTGAFKLTNNGKILFQTSSGIKLKLDNYGTLFNNGANLFVDAATGQINSKSGSILNGNGNLSAGSGGSINLEAGSTLIPNSSYNVYGDNITISGELVTAAFTSINLQANATVSNAKFTTPGGFISFSPDATTTFSGTITGTGAERGVRFGNNDHTFKAAAGGATINLASGQALLINPTFDGANPLTFASMSYVSGTIIVKNEVAVTGILNFTDGGNASINMQGPAALFHIKSGGAANFQSNDGGQAIYGSVGSPLGVKIDAGGLFSRTGFYGGVAISVPLDNLGTYSNTGGNNNISGSIAQLVGTPGNTTLTGGTWIQGTQGFFDWNGRTINTLGANATVVHGDRALYFPAIDALNNVQGTLHLTEGVDEPLTSALTNSGHIILDPGTSLSVGSYTQTSGGSVEFQISGTDIDHIGRLIGSGAASLAGTAVITLANGYVPAVNDTFQLEKFASHTGQFTTVQGLGGGNGVAFEAAYTATDFHLNAIGGGSADLGVTAITPPANGVAGQNVSLSYTVKNLGGPTSASGWVDTIYLSKDGSLDGSDVILGHVAHSGVLGAGASYTANPTLPLVGVLPGSYHLVVVADSQGHVADVSRVNNTAASTGTLAVSFQALTPGTALNGTIKAGQNLYYQVTLPAGKTPTFTFTGAVNGAAEIFESLGKVPTLADFDAGTFNAGSTVQRITGATTASATYFILLRGRENAGNGVGFSLVASGVGLTLTGSSATRGSNVGRVTTTLTGSQFTADTLFKLVGATTRNALANLAINSTTASATFDLTGLSAGSYSIVATDPGSTATLAGAFTVVASSNAGKLRYDLSVPRAIRPPYAGVAATLTYSNTGGTDLDAPLIVLTAENARIRLAGQSDFVPATYTLVNGHRLATFDLLAVSGGAAGTLSPGESGRIDVTFEPINTSAHALSTFNAYALASNSAAPIHTDGLKEELRPDGITSEAWDAIYANFKAGIGSTVGSYTAMLDDNANYLSQFGAVSPDTFKLLQFEIEQADNFGAISKRYAVGTLGRGSVTPFSSRLAESDGLVTITEGSSTRFFHNVGSSYIADADDAAKLTRSGSTYTLTEVNGRTTRFRSDGRIDFVQFSNGERTTTAYNGSGQLTSITTNSTGDVTSYTYNARGTIATITDPVGRVTSFAYDATGQHLLSISSASGTTTMTYVTGQGASREHALASITTPNGVTTTYTYDPRGRLLSETVGTGPDAITTTYTYTGAGQITIRDAAGNARQYFLGLAGNILRSVDPLGHATTAQLDAGGRVVGVTDASGVSSGISYGASDVASTLVNPDRSQVNIETSGDPLRITKIINPKGGITGFTNDASGNLTNVTLPDGSGESYEYDAFGRVTAHTDGNGQRTTFAYNAAGLISRRTAPGGATVDYTYDSHRNLVTATDANGTTGLAYDAADRLTDATYPNGKSVHITYDAFGRRASIADGAGYTVKYSYDSLGRVSSLRDTTDALIVSYAYNALGQLTGETRGNGASTAYTYDARGRTITIVHRDASNAIVAQFAYTYDALNHIKTVVSQAGTTAYDYDLNGQLVGVQLPGGRGITYAYDLQGNRTTVNDSVVGTSNYTTNAGDAYTAAGGATMTYNAAGQMITRTAGGVTTTFAYNPDGSLAGATKSGSVITYQYDALGNRTGKTENGVHTDYALDPVGLGVLFGEYTGATTVNYADGQGIAARVTSGGTSYYHYDADGNTAALTGAAGSATDSFSYLPFGESLSHTGSTVQPFTFDGRLGVTGDNSGLFDMRSRSYDPTLGRFTSRDALGVNGGDTNLYRFVNNDPVNHSDPSGQDDIYAGGGVTAILGFGFNVGGGGYSNSEDGWDTGLFLSAGGGIGVDLGLNAYAGQSTDISGYAGNASAGAGGGATTVTYDDKGNVSGFNSGFSWGSKLAGGGSYTQSQTLKISPRSIANALGIPGPEKIDRRPEAQLGRSPASFLNKVGNSQLFRDLVKDGLDSGKPLQDAILDAITFLRKNGIYDPIHNPDPQIAENVRPGDPNNIIGPAGAGADPLPDIIAPGQVRFDGYVTDHAYPFRIEFENKPSASAPAQVVTVTQTLDADLDLSTFKFSSFGFGNFLVNVPDNAIGSSFSTVVDATGTLGVKVKIDAAVNLVTRVLSVTFTSLDPTTNNVPLDALLGFLPPNTTDPEGDGFITYSVSPKTGLASGTVFDSLATVVFDTEDSLNTPAVHNTLDTLAPTSKVAAMPATTTNATFNVTWSGTDGGSGLDLFDVFVSDNGAAYAPLLENTALTSTPFTGTVGHTYTFYSIGKDKVGNVELAPAVADAKITVNAVGPVDTTKPTSSVTALPAMSSSLSFTLSWSGTDNAGGSGVKSYDIFVSNNGSAYTLLYDNTTATSNTFTGVNGHTYSFYSVATDNAGNVENKAATAEATTHISTGGGATGSISGVLWNDADSDGIFDANESVSGARQVFIDTNANGKLDAGERSVMSDSRGRYTFNSLAAGVYNISRVFPTGYHFSNTPLSFLATTVADGQQVTNVNIGTTNKPIVTPPPVGGSIAGTLFNDNDKDGIFDANEAATGARVVFIDSNSNGKLDAGEKSVMSDSAGRYKFSGLAAGPYKVSRVFPSGYRLSNNNAGYVLVTLAANQQQAGVNLGTRTL